ncbi:isopentenyl phosphate kinase [Methanothermobacter wolfeii]|uniref:Isopentenyl phosphate kinase n=1 Tax=Methanothermobacter wolfeii TaxID=145261 RepID=A0A9E7UHC8_METWO|nr:MULTISPECIES: isopentenyl phosphate kinase [Methanothermobacter]MDI6702406.1 isopentenyl phosphate kinase [Methanothermobacter wolfeii]MDI6841959.1 isopentenyl phosphate kinase [Methanothermobacter wolfeii]NLM03209.1 isopentenyl phosphate kinase family protein [Methanothermobacter wolfeii]QHN06026.1 isopentenyl phosphate kinase family protein [Methanothermobacter sp. THM-1]UXH32194.1 isopentenyl phosphate kinase [Methanothermobacter wolfeii]
MIILKLGGSVITRKDSDEPRIDMNNLQRIASEVANASPSSLLIIHGAGSFGHPFAMKYSIGSEIVDEDEFRYRRMGFGITQNWVKRLNTHVCQALLDEGIPAVSVQPSAFMVAEDGRIKDPDLSLIRSYLDEGFVPVSYGDVVLDLNRKRRFSVVSGDQLINHFSAELMPERVILGTDVDGVYTRDPRRYPDAELLEVIGSIHDLEALEGTVNTDVTGGMAGKIRELLALAEKGVESEIINASVKGNIEGALMGREVRGTRITLKG